MQIRIAHEFATTEQAFFDLFFDRDAMVKMYREFMSFPECEIRQSEDDAKISRTIVAVPKMDMPAALAKIAGSSVRYTEDGTFDKKSKLFTWKTIPSILTDKIRNEGTMRVETIGENKIRRTAEIELSAKVFGLGGMIESTFEKTIRDGWERATQFFRQELEKK